MHYASSFKEIHNVASFTHVDIGVKFVATELNVYLVAWTRIGCPHIEYEVYSGKQLNRREFHRRLRHNRTVGDIPQVLCHCTRNRWPPLPHSELLPEVRV